MTTKSVMSVFAEKERLEAQAKRLIEELAQKLAELIPASLTAFASNRGWIRQKPDGWWRLPEVLENLVNFSKQDVPGPLSMRFWASDLSGTGFTRLAQVEAAFNELATAWQKYIRIEVRHSTETEMFVYLYLVEVEYPTYDE